MSSYICEVMIYSFIGVEARKNQGKNGSKRDKGLILHQDRLARMLETR